MSKTELQRKIALDISKVIPKDAQILDSNLYNDLLEIGFQWQVHKYIEEDSYREIRLTIEKDKSNDYYSIILGDDLIDYDKTASGEEQYFMTFNGDTEETYNKVLTTFSRVSELIEQTKHSPKGFQFFIDSLDHIGFTCRNLSGK